MLGKRKYSMPIGLFKIIASRANQIEFVYLFSRDFDTSEEST